MRIYIYIYIHTHTHTHVYNTHTYVYIYIYIYMTDTHKCKLPWVYDMHACMYLCVRVYEYMYVSKTQKNSMACMHVCTCVCEYMGICMCLRLRKPRPTAYIHTQQEKACIHRHKRVHKYIRPCRHIHMYAHIHHQHTNMDRRSRALLYT